MLTINTKDIYGALGVQRGKFCIEYAKDNNGRRASLISHNDPDAWQDLLNDHLVIAQVAHIQQLQHDHQAVNADSVLQAAWENHHIARQKGNINASNTALTIVAKHSAVDAFAADKVQLSSAEDNVAVLMRARKRGQRLDNAIDGEIVTPEELSHASQDNEVSFL